MTIDALTIPVYTGDTADTEGLYSSIKPVRYRYVMAYLHPTVEEIKNPDGSVAETVTHQAGEVMAILPMTQVNYTVGMYAGTDLSGNVYLPGMYLDLMAHPPSNDYTRWIHPDQQGVPLGSMFECGNRALYIMRNEEVVWGGILWTRNYSSGSATMAITGISWEGYAYYRQLRKSIVFKKTNQYAIWWAVLDQMLNDFTFSDKKHGNVLDATHIKKNKAGDIIKTWYSNWTGHTGTTSNAELTNFKQVWPNNSPLIELPPSTLKLYQDPNATKKVEVVVDKTWRGYDLGSVGEVLEEWADTETIASIDGGKRFEYRVVCWYDTAQQRFRQRYVFGRMKKASDSTTNEPTVSGIISPILGSNTEVMAKSTENQLVFDYPGHISSWALAESMDDAATRAIVTGNGDAAAKLAEYAVDKDQLDVPKTGSNRGRQGWLLYDRTGSYGTSKPSDLQSRAERLVQLFHVPTAMQISDLTDATKKQRTSRRSTSLNITLYQEPTIPHPDWELGDWATFAIADPFYGGTMYLVRRIIGYSVTVVPEQESDYSHEEIQLELTDDWMVDLE